MADFAFTVSYFAIGLAIAGATLKRRGRLGGHYEVNDGGVSALFWLVQIGCVWPVMVLVWCYAWFKSR